MCQFNDAVYKRSLGTLQFSKRPFSDQDKTSENRVIRFCTVIRVIAHFLREEEEPTSPNVDQTDPLTGPFLFVKEI